jgi:hypothetical protein
MGAASLLYNLHTSAKAAYIKPWYRCESPMITIINELNQATFMLKTPKKIKNCLVTYKPKIQDQFSHQDNILEAVR